MVLLLLWSIPEVSNIWPYCCGLIAPCVFFRKSYQAQEKWMSSSELPSYRIWSCCTDWIKSISVIITLRMIAPQLQPKCLFLAMFALGRNFRRFNGTWAIVHSLLYGSVPSSPQRKKKKKNEGMSLRSLQNKAVPLRWPEYIVILYLCDPELSLGLVWTHGLVIRPVHRVQPFTTLNTRLVKNLTYFYLTYC